MASSFANASARRPRDVERDRARARVELGASRSSSAKPRSTERRAPPAQRATSAAVASLGANAGSSRRRRQRAMQLGGDRAELLGLGPNGSWSQVAVAVGERARAGERVGPTVHRAGDESREHPGDGARPSMLDDEHRVQLGRVAKARCAR